MTANALESFDIKANIKPKEETDESDESDEIDPTAKCIFELLPAYYDLAEDDDIGQPDTETEDEIDVVNSLAKIANNIQSGINSGATEALKEDCSFLVPTNDWLGKDYGIAFHNPAGILAQHPQKYCTKRELEAAIEHTKACLSSDGMHLVEHILLRPEIGDEANGCKDECTLVASPNVACELDLPTTDVDPCLTEAEAPTYIPGADPYSFIATTVLPCWSKKYQDANFRAYVMNTLYRQTPAHIGLNVIWSSPKQLCKFETQYLNWLQWKSKEKETLTENTEIVGVEEVVVSAKATTTATTTTCIEGDMPCDLINCLLELKSKPFTPPETTEANCKTQIDQAAVQVNLAQLAIQQQLSLGQNYQSPLLQAGIQQFPIVNGQIQWSPQSLQTIIEQPLTILGSNVIDLSRPFLQNIEAIQNPNVLKTKTFQQTLSFAKRLKEQKLSKSTITELQDKVIHFSLRYAIGKKGGGDDKIYTDLLTNSLALTLDKLVEDNKTEIQYKDELSTTLQKIKEKDIDLQKVKELWFTEALQQKIHDTPVINDYLKLFDEV